MAREPVVILDTNALLMPFQFGINLDAELQRLVGDCSVLVPSPVLGELRRLLGEDVHAKAAIDLAGKYEVVEVQDSGDAAIISLAKKEDGIVVTNDKQLIGELKKSRIPVIFMRSRNHLVLEGML